MGAVTRRGDEGLLDYAIIGAGPAGLQLAYFLRRAGVRCRVLERDRLCGSFFTSFPRSRRLLSINKPITGHEGPINLRWDWNSLLTEEPAPPFTSYTSDYFPHADTYVRYLGDFAERHRLPVETGCDVAGITREGERFVVHARDGRAWRARAVVVATGYGRERRPPIPGAEHCQTYGTYDPVLLHWTGKRVAIVGKGNSAFETGDWLSTACSAIHLVSPNPVRFAWKTHYVGHLRAVNNNLLDTYQLKSQNTILDATVERVRPRPEGGLGVDIAYTHAAGERLTVDVDEVVLCTGFECDDALFDGGDVRPAMGACGRYPDLTEVWESTNESGLFFAGALMHGADHGHGFSGFIHGFRYNVRHLAEVLLHRYQGGSLRTHRADASPRGMAEGMIERATTTSSLFQQPGVLCDLWWMDGAGDGARVAFGVPVGHLGSELYGLGSRCLTMTLEYGEIPPGTDPFAVPREPDDGEASTFIHPVVRVYRDGELAATHHVPEELENRWRAPRFIEPLTAFLAGHVPA